MSHSYAASAHSHAHAASSAGAAQQPTQQAYSAAASTPATAAASVPASAAPRKSTREGKVAHLTPELVAQHRRGWTRLLRGTDFVASHRRFLASLQPSLSLLNLPAHAAAVDLSVDQLKVETPFTKIDRAIGEEVAAALVYQTQQKRAKDEAKAANMQHIAAMERTKMQLQQQQAMMHNANIGAGARATATQMQLQQQQQARTPEQSTATAAAGASHFSLEDPSHAHAHSSAADHMQLDMPPIHAHGHGHGQGEEMHAGHDTHNHEGAASSSAAAAAAAASSSSAAAATSMDHSDELQDTQPVLSSQASMMLSQQTDATIPAAAVAGASAAAAFGFADIDSLSAMVAATAAAASAPPHASNSSSSSTSLLTPPGFGSRVPKYNALMDPLRSLLADRAHALGKRGRLESNCVTPRSMEHDKRRSIGNQPVLALDPEDILLRVSIYHPTLHSKMQEYLVLGSQPLTALRDALRDRLNCLADLDLDGPSTPSACFFIEGCFYDDMRLQRAIRLSDTVVEWVRDGGRYTHPTLSHFGQKLMESTRFDEIPLRLGSHYLYQHQGQCPCDFLPLALLRAGARSLPERFSPCLLRASVCRS